MAPMTEYIVHRRDEFVEWLEEDMAMSPVDDCQPPDEVSLVLAPSGNVTSHPAQGFGSDWPVLDDGVHILRGTQKDHVILLTIDGDPAEAADWLQVLADVVTEAARLSVCSGCGWRFDPRRVDRPAGLDFTQCGKCVA